MEANKKNVEIPLTEKNLKKFEENKKKLKSRTEAIPLLYKIMDDLDELLNSFSKTKKEISSLKDGERFFHFGDPYIATDKFGINSDLSSSRFCVKLNTGVLYKFKLEEEVDSF